MLLKIPSSSGSYKSIEIREFSIIECLLVKDSSALDICIQLGWVSREDTREHKRLITSKLSQYLASRWRHILEAAGIQYNRPNLIRFLKSNNLRQDLYSDYLISS